jgi:hypothetical protein
VSVLGLEKAGALILIVLGSQAVARWRVSRRERAQSNLPLFDAVVLETALAPRSTDDPATLDALRDIFRQHRRVQDAGALKSALTIYSESLNEAKQATVRRVASHIGLE